MILITALACFIGGYGLIDTQFRMALDREVSALYEENDLLRYALAQELSFNPMYSRKELAAAASGIQITTGRGNISFRLSGETGEMLGGSGRLPVNASDLIAKLPAGQRGWRMTPLGDGKIYLHAVSPLALEDGILYLENCREVSELFSSRSEQYQSFFVLMLILTGAVGILSLIISAMLLRPLGLLSSATRKIAAGELSQRVPVHRDDELGQLSADFNAMAERMERQVQELKDAARKQEDFIGSFAHEIKTPLTSIIGYADLLRSRSISPEQVRESADYIFSEGQRLESLSRKLMDLIVLDRQDFVLNPVSMDLFLQQIGGMIRPVLEQQGIRLIIQAEPAVILLEPDLMKSVCLNLLDNARKALDIYRDKFDKTGFIKLEGIAEENGYCIQITDNGKGIPAEELTRVTEAFYMIDKSRSRAQGGAGLGLALCQRIVDLHGGRLELKSVLGKGTQICVYLEK